MGIPHVVTGVQPSSSAQNLLIDKVNEIDAKLNAVAPFVKKPTDTPRSSMTTPADDPDLGLTLSSGIWIVKACLLPTGPAAADFRCLWTLASGAAQLTIRQCVGPSSTVTGVHLDAAARHSAHPWSTAVTYGTDGTTTPSVIHEEGLVQVTGGAGTIRLQWCQAVTSTTAVILTANSYVYAFRAA